MLFRSRAALKGEPELEKFNQVIEKAKDLTEQKRYYVSTYGFKNAIDYINCKTDTLIKGDDYDKFELNNIIEWWRDKAIKRYETLYEENRLRTRSFS